MIKNLCQSACIMARDPEFIRWVSQLSEQPCTSDDAAELIRLACKIESRRELDTNVAAQALFNYSIRRPYARWKAEQMEVA